MPRSRALFAGTSLPLLLVLAGCATGQQSSGLFSAPQTGDDGVVIAESRMIPGQTTATSVVGQVDDCTGPGLGIAVQSTTSGGNYLYDSNGEPCESANILFDGRLSANSRAADPAISLTFHDALGPLPARSSGNLPSLQPLPRIKVTSELIPVASNVEPAAGPTKVPAKPAPVAPAKPDALVATLATWQKQDEVMTDRATEADAAAARNIQHISAQTRTSSEQETVARLMSQLRERERQVQEEQRRNGETLARAQQNREVASAAQTAWQQKENQLQAELAATQQRLTQFEQLNQRLASENTAKEKTYQNKISTLSADLKAAEAQAETSRRTLILQAAAKIAEAEQIAHAAQLQEQDIKLREAARLKSEAETMLDRALAINAGRSVVVGNVGAPSGAPMALMATPIVLHVTQQTLPDILTTVLKLAAPQAGQWSADWQLSGPAQAILKEKWSLTAEASVQQVLSQLQQQVKAAHGITLSFTQFNQSRLLVVTDAPSTKQTAEK